MSAVLAGHAHAWLPGPPGARRTLLMLHGTGGDERDLLPIAKMLDADANVLSPRGNVLEHGAPRFFARLAPGVLDVDDLHRRTRELAAFVRDASAAYAFPLEGVIAVGFSNGANIAAAMLFETPDALAGAILMRAMVPFRPATPRLAGKRALILGGARDPYSHAEVSEELAAILRAGGARVDVRLADAGHELTQGDVDAARAWLRSTDLSALRE